MLTDETLAQWAEWARRDDACNLFVPSDMRQLIGEVQRLRRLRDNLLSYLNGISRTTAEMVRANSPE